MKISTLLDHKAPRQEVKDLCTHYLTDLTAWRDIPHSYLSDPSLSREQQAWRGHLCREKLNGNYSLKLASQDRSLLIINFHFHLISPRLHLFTSIQSDATIFFLP